MSNSKVIYPSDHTVTVGHVTNELHYVFFQILTLVKNSFGDDTLLLKLFHFCINFINFLTNVCVDQVVLKIRVFNQEKISDQHCKIPDQEFKLIIKGKS